MREFSTYRVEVERLLERALRPSTNATSRSAVVAALDGEPAEALRRLIPLEELRAAGVFFTGTRIARLAAASLNGSVHANSRIIDPAVGAGNLLIACARLLPARRHLWDTIELWSEVLRGSDLSEEFVLTARARLAMAALGRHSATYEQLPHHRSFQNIVAASCFSSSDAIAEATHVVVNPPYSRTDAPADCEWAGGTVNQAAVFLEFILKAASPGTRVVALLPDVLRSGTRYHLWRNLVARYATVVSLRKLGQFDSKTDVDVFLLDLRAAKKNGLTVDYRWNPSRPSGSTLSDHFDVSVGAVVDYRDAKKGPWYPFLHARAAQGGRVQSDIPDRRRFQGRVFKAPFVAVRRTSRFGDRVRAIATVIDGPTAVAVENHMLVLSPKNGTKSRCLAALRILSSPEATNYLNQRIRCRHLTVGAIAALPWPSK